MRALISRTIKSCRKGDKKLSNGAAMWNVNAFIAFTQPNSSSAISTLFVKGVFQAKLWTFIITGTRCTAL
jgi:hypothetical protein